MQAKDIPDSEILSFLADRQGDWTMYWEIPTFEKYPLKVFRAKMKSLHKRELVGGCPCGCRGDYEITDKGLALINRPRVKPYTGY